MKRRPFCRILFIVWFLPIYIVAQPASLAESDITGLWKGALYNDTTKKYLPYEIAISDEKGKLIGYSYTLFDIDGKKELGIKRIKITRKGDQITIEDMVLISNTYTEPPPRKVRQQSIVSLLVNDTSMQLTGTWSTNRTREYRPLTGSLQLQRARDYKPQVLFEQLVALNLDKDLSFVKEKNKREADIAAKEKPSAEIKSPVIVLPPVVDADKPKESVSSILAEKIEDVVENASLIKVAKASTQLNEKYTHSKPVIVPVGEKRKQVIVATSYIKKENIPPLNDKSKILTPSPVIAKSQPVGIIKQPVKESKPPAEIVKKMVAAEKPKAIPTAVVSNKTAPLTVVKTPVNTESKTSAIVSAPPEKKKELPVTIIVPNAMGAAASVAERKINKEQSVYFESDSLVLTLYDNGDVDGDTVSVLMNGQIIFARQGLSTTANSKTIYVDKETTDSLSMIMYAENLGSIPPNTGLMIIMDGEKRYEVRFSADLKTNAAILLRRKVKE